MELSWKLRGASGSDNSFIDCDETGQLTNDKGPIEGVGRLLAIEVSWSGSGADSLDPVACSGSAFGSARSCTDDRAYARFRCSNGHGITGFALPPGDVALTVSPICANGEPADPSTYSAPAPVRRSVTAGDTVSLGAVELVLQVDCSLGGTCICL